MPESDGALAEAILALADDEMVLAHRNSEWSGHGPILEEDIAFSNLALDEMGHARLWYRLVAELRGEDPETYPDALVFFREAGDFRNLRLVELPRGDWAFSMLRQYLFDVLERVRLAALVAGRDVRLAAIAAKISREEAYHLRHTSAWVLRLGRGTEESRRRMQAALDEIWPHAAQMFSPLPGVVGESPLEGGALAESWRAVALPHLGASGLAVLGFPRGDFPGREEHTPHLSLLLAEMQQVARAEPEATW